MVHGLYHNSAICHFNFSPVDWTRGNSYKLQPSIVKHKFTRNYFTNRIIKNWNSLPEYVVNAPTVASFESCLDKFWSTQDLFYNWHAVITGTGNHTTTL